MVGPGHFGLLDLGEGVQKFSMHWEADLDRGGASVLDIRPLLWKDGWPVAGENMKEGTYEIESVRTGTALELAVEGVSGWRRPRADRGGDRRQLRVGRGGLRPAAGAPLRAQRRPVVRLAAGGRAGAAGRRRRRRRNVRRHRTLIPPQDVAQVSTNWPAGNIRSAHGQLPVPGPAEVGNYRRPQRRRLPRLAVFQDHHRRHGSHAGRHREGELVVLPAFTGAPEQLWRIDQLADGTWRIMPKSVPNSKEPMALSAIGASFATLEKFDPSSNKQHGWSNLADRTDRWKSKNVCQGIFHESAP